MTLPYRIVLAASLAAAVSGCTRKEAPTDISGRPASSQAPATGKPAPLPETADRETRYRDAIVSAVVENPDVASLIPRKPTMGGTWRVGGKEDVQFLGNGTVAIEYEDGHVAGRLVVKVEDPHDVKTWKVIRDEPR
jgi:hypothetical protein